MGIAGGAKNRSIEEDCRQDGQLLKTVDSGPEFAHAAFLNHRVLVFAVAERTHFNFLVTKLHGAGDGGTQAGVDLSGIGISENCFYIRYGKFATDHYGNSIACLLHQMLQGRHCINGVRAAVHDWSGTVWAEGHWRRQFWL